MSSNLPAGPGSSWKNTTNRGIVHADRGRQAFHLERSEAGALSPWVEHLWEVTWNLPPGQTFTQRVLSFPNLHLVWEQVGDHPVTVVLHGVPQGPYERTLTGSGRALGARFRPGGWSGFDPRPAAHWTGREVPAAALWDSASVPETPDAEAVLAFLSGRNPGRSDEADQADRLVSLIRDDPKLLRSEEVAEAAGRSVRGLQRLFHQYVGVSPKWVIRRFRLQEAAQALEADPGLDGGTLAHRLGYFDQAHFIKDFKAVLGVPPSRY